MTETEIRSIVDKLVDLARVVSDADPDDKSEILRQLGLRLTYHPRRQLLEAKIHPAYGFLTMSEGRLHQKPMPPGYRVRDVVRSHQPSFSW